VTRSDTELIHETLEHLAALHRHIKRGDVADETVADAVSLRLSAAIETRSQTSDPFRERVFGSDWRAMWATRNRIAHGYIHIDLELIRTTVERDIPMVERRLRAEIG
jgi:uncharacterized protein with HEPN domain